MVGIVLKENIFSIKPQLYYRFEPKLTVLDFEPVVNFKFHIEDALCITSRTENTQWSLILSPTYYIVVQPRELLPACAVHDASGHDDLVSSFGGSALYCMQRHHPPLACSMIIVGGPNST